MKLKRQNRKDLFFIALTAIALGIFNLAIKRFIDGTLCIIAGICILFVWNKKRRK